MMLVLLLFMLYLMLLCVYRLMIRKHVKEVKTELEKGEQDRYCQQPASFSSHRHHCPSDMYRYLPPSLFVIQHINQCPPVPLTEVEIVSEAGKELPSRFGDQQ